MSFSNFRRFESLKFELLIQLSILQIVNLYPLTCRMHDERVKTMSWRCLGFEFLAASRAALFLEIAFSNSLDNRKRAGLHISRIPRALCQVSPRINEPQTQRHSDSGVARSISLECDPPNEPICVAPLVLSSQRCFFDSTGLRRRSVLTVGQYCARISAGISLDFAGALRRRLAIGHTSNVGTEVSKSANSHLQPPTSIRRPLGSACWDAEALVRVQRVWREL